MPETGSKRGIIACLLTSGFEDSEFRVPYDRLSQAGYQVEIIGFKAGEKLQGEKGKETAVTDLSIGDAEADDYVALLIPGGYSPDKLRADDRTRDIPVLAITGYGDRQYGDRALVAGADHVLAKPCDPALIVSEARRLLLR